MTSLNPTTGEVTFLPSALPDNTSSSSIGKIVAALAKAQATFGAVVKDKTATVKHKEGGGQHSYKYATLDGVLEACREALNSNGIAYTQPVRHVDRGVVVKTILMYEDEWISDYGVYMPAGSTPQATGSAITYARRYGITSLLGIAQEDDDGQAAAGTTPTPASKQREASVKLAPKARRDTLSARIKKLPEQLFAQVEERTKSEGIVWTQLTNEQLATVAGWVEECEAIALVDGELNSTNEEE